MVYEISTNTWPAASIEIGFSDSIALVDKSVSNVSKSDAVFSNLIRPYPVFSLFRGTGGRVAALYLAITALNAEKKSLEFSITHQLTLLSVPF